MLDISLYHTEFFHSAVALKVQFSLCARMEHILYATGTTLYDTLNYVPLSVA